MECTEGMPEPGITPRGGDVEVVYNDWYFRVRANSGTCHDAECSSTSTPQGPEKIRVFI
jgi:hypothetical protein